MKNKKGFTLIELIVCFVIISALAVATSVSILSKKNNAISKNEEEILSEIFTAAYTYSASDNGEENYCISIQNLIDNGYIDETKNKFPIKIKNIELNTTDCLTPVIKDNERIIKYKGDTLNELIENINNSDEDIDTGNNSPVKYKFKINVDESVVNCTINKIEGTSLVADVGSLIKWKCDPKIDGCVTINNGHGEVKLNSNHEENVSLNYNAYTIGYLGFAYLLEIDKKIPITYTKFYCGKGINVDFVPEYKGYTFMGFCIKENDDDCKKDVDFSKSVKIGPDTARNINILTLYKPNSFNILYKDTDGSNLSPGNNVEAPSGYVMGLGVTIKWKPEKNGYSFVGWCDSKDLTNCSKEYTIKTSAKSDVTLYAKWINSSKLLKYDNNGGSGCSDKTIYYDKKYEELCVPSKTGYVFKGWQDSNKNLVTKDDIVKGDITLTAKWEKENYTLTFNSKGGSNCSKITKEYSAKWGTLCSPTKGNGTSFGGWFTGENGTGSQVTSDTTVDRNMTVYAKWEYILTYNSNGGSSCGSQKAVENTAWGSLCTPTKDKNTFKGWYNGSSEITSSTSATGNITVTASWEENKSCLAEGTKIRLANGKTKNIEDIGYNDLLLVINHDTGKVGYEYPVWIEAEGIADYYQENVFSDGSVLNTVGDHSVFSVDAGKYVLVGDSENFHIGTRIIKINKKNEKEIVSVTNIKTIKMKVKYYHVSSNYYHNIIAENILTTDPTIVVSNMFTFNKDLTWGKDREEFLNKNDLFTYKDLSMYVNEHLFYGYRMSEVKILYNKNELDVDMYYNILNGNFVEPDKDINGNNLWIINIGNYDKNLYTEGSNIILPIPRNVSGKVFKGYYNHGDNKYYYPGDKIKVMYSMYLEPIWG